MGCGFSNFGCIFFLTDLIGFRHVVFWSETVLFLRLCRRDLEKTPFSNSDPFRAGKVQNKVQNGAEVNTKKKKIGA
jgi:hypothetical protein